MCNDELSPSNFLGCVNLTSTDDLIKAIRVIAMPANYQQRISQLTIKIGYIQGYLINLNKLLAIAEAHEYYELCVEVKKEIDKTKKYIEELKNERERTWA